MQEILSGKWRVYSPQNTLPFFTRRRHQTGATKSNRQRIISEGPNWYFLSELKRKRQDWGGDESMASRRGLAGRESEALFSYLTFQRVSWDFW